MKNIILNLKAALFTLLLTVTFGLVQAQCPVPVLYEQSSEALDGENCSITLIIPYTATANNTSISFTVISGGTVLLSSDCNGRLSKGSHTIFLGPFELPCGSTFDISYQSYKSPNCKGGACTNGKVPESVLLPVELVAFEAEQSNDAARLSWITASETNNKEFIIEKGDDGVNFMPIGAIEGGGNKNSESVYDFYDYDLEEGVSYYRLKQVDYDGKTDYSEVIALTAIINTTEITVFPNPVSDIIYIKGLETNNSVISLYDNIGNLIATKSVSNDTETLNFKELNLENGQYFINVWNEMGIIQSKMVIYHS